MIKIRDLLALAAGALLGFGAVAAHAAETVRIGWLRAPNDITLAKSRGTLEKALGEKGVRVEWAGPFPAAAPAFEALNAGSIDITAGSSTSVIAALSAGLPVVVFGYQKMTAASEGILVKKDSRIGAVGDLVGKKVAVNRGGTGEYLLMRALDRNGIDPSSVERVFLSPSDSGPSFLQDHVDAWATWDPFVSIAETSYGGKVLADGAAIGSDNAVVLVASRKFAGEKRGILKEVFDVLRQENAWAVGHQEEAGAVWAREMNLPLELADRIGANNAVPTTPVSDADAAQIGRIADWYVDSGIIPSRPDLSSGIVYLP